MTRPSQVRRRLLSRWPRQARALTSVLVAGLLVVVASGCEDAEQRAVRPGAVQDFATEVSAGESDGKTVESVAPLEDMKVQGEKLPPAQRVFFAHGADLWQIPARGDPEAVVDGDDLTSFSPSATGERVAIVRAQPDNGAERTMLTFLDGEGETSPVLDAIINEIDTDAISRIDAASTSPSGDKLAMAHQNGAMTMISLDGRVQQLIDPSPELQPGQIEWSSNGQLIAFLSPWPPEDAASLYVLVPESGIRQVLVPAADGNGDGVVQAEWIPGTSTIVYIRPSESTIAWGGDVFAVDATTGERTLLVSSGSFAPVAGVVDVAVSPDGARIALTVFVPGADAPEFAGLQMFDLRSGVIQEVEVEQGYTVTDIWWLGHRLLYRTVDQPRSKLPGAYTGLESFQLREYDPSSGGTTTRYIEGDTEGADEEDGDDNDPDDE